MITCDNCQKKFIETSDYANKMVKKKLSTGDESVSFKVMTDKRYCKECFWRIVLAYAALGDEVEGFVMADILKIIDIDK